MANYLELRNDNNVTVINDEFPLPCLLFRGTVTTNVNNTPVGVNAFRLYASYNYYGMVTKVATVSDDLYSLGINLPYSSENITLFNNNIIAFYRSDSGQGCMAQFSLVQSSSSNPVELQVVLSSSALGVSGEIVAYCLNPKLLLPRNFGGHFKNSSGEVVFEFMRGPMQIIGTMSGAVNTYNDPAATYEFNIPSGLDANNVFISCRSSLPFHSAYKINSKGVSQSSSIYEPRLTWTTSKLTVNLVRQSPISGTNSVYSYGGYFENIAYVVQPRGWYI